MNKHAVGIVGVGNMGGAMAARLLEGGWPVHVCDIDLHRVRMLEQQGARVHHTPAQCADAVAALIVCVVDTPQVETVLFGPAGAASALRPGQDVLLCPTIAPPDTERFAARLLEQGVATIDAPMSGGPARARDGSMSLMLAGGEDAIGRRGGLLDALSSKLFRISARPGDGARTKLVNNLLAGINLVGAAEAIALAERLGLDPGATLALIGQSSGQSWIGSDRMQRAIAGDFEPRAHMTLLAKDTRLAVEAAAAAGFAGPLGAAAQAVFARACESGLADRDDGALLQLMRQSPAAPAA